MDKLLVTVIGNQNSGKSFTWNSLFNNTVKTGKMLRKLYLTDNEYVNVFLVSGSPEERGIYVGKLITQKNPAIVLCSMQYLESVKQTINYFVEKEYQIFCHWLNPGFADKNNSPKPDELEIFSYFLELNSCVGIRSGKTDPKARIQELREYIYGWAKYRGLILTDN